MHARKMSNDVDLELLQGWHRRALTYHPFQLRTFQRWSPVHCLDNPLYFDAVYYDCYAGAFLSSIHIVRPSVRVLNACLGVEPPSGERYQASRNYQ